MSSGYGAGFGGLVRSTDSIHRDGLPIAVADEKRLVERPNGMAVWVTITQAEKRRYINMCPKGWNRPLLMREEGKTIDEIAASLRMETELCRDSMALAYGWVEQQLYRLAEYKAGVRK